MQPTPGRTALLTLFALSCFAANSLLCRAALRVHLIDPASFTLVRLGAGAAALVLILKVRGRIGTSAPGGSWGSATCLVAYAVCFSQAYVRIDAGVGALLLFGAVQAAMLGWSVANGTSPAVRQWLGLVVALLGLAWLLLPGKGAPDPVGASLMLAAGVGWGAYSVRGRGVRDATAATAANFARSLPLAALTSLPLIPAMHSTPPGLLLAAASGALTSAVGYTAWYAVLPRLGPVLPAVMQLTVPVLALAASAVWLGEPLEHATLEAAGLILAGVGLALSTTWRRRAAPAALSR